MKTCKWQYMDLKPQPLDEPESVKSARKHTKLRVHRRALIVFALLLFVAAYYRETVGIRLEWLSGIGVCLVPVWFWLNRHATGSKRRREPFTSDKKS